MGSVLTWLGPKAWPTVSVDCETRTWIRLLECEVSEIA